MSCFTHQTRPAPVKDAAGKSLVEIEAEKAAPTVSPMSPSLPSNEWESPFAFLSSAAHPPLWQEHRQYLQQQQQGQQWYRPVPYCPTDRCTSSSYRKEERNSPLPPSGRSVEGFKGRQAYIDGFSPLEPMSSWSSGDFSLVGDERDDVERGEVEEEEEAGGGMLEQAHGLQREMESDPQYAITSTSKAAAAIIDIDESSRSQAAYNQIKKQLVEEAWIKDRLSFDMEPAELARRVRQLHVDKVPIKSVLHLSAWYVKREAPTSAYSTAYLREQSIITRRTTERRRRGMSEKHKNSRRAAQRKRRETAQGERFAKIIQDLRAGGIDFTLPVEKLEDETRGVSLGKDCKAGTCTAAIRWYLKHHRSAHDWRKFRDLRAKNRNRGLYSKAQRDARRAKVIQAWKDNNLTLDMEPEDLAMAVRNLIVEGVPHQCVLMISSGLVSKHQSSYYKEAYLNGQAWLTSRISDRRRLLHDPKWRLANYASKERKRQQDREAKHAVIISRLQKQGLVDFSLPVDELERMARGVKLDDATSVTCTAAIKWYLEITRSIDEREQFQQARSQAHRTRKRVRRPRT